MVVIVRGLDRRPRRPRRLNQLHLRFGGHSPALAFSERPCKLAASSRRLGESRRIRKEVRSHTRVYSEISIFFHSLWEITGAYEIRLEADSKSRRTDCASRAARTKSAAFLEYSSATDFVTAAILSPICCKFDTLRYDSIGRRDESSQIDMDIQQNAHWTSLQVAAPRKVQKTNVCCWSLRIRLRESSSTRASTTASTLESERWLGVASAPIAASYGDCSSGGSPAGASSVDGGDAMSGCDKWRTQTSRGAAR